MLQGSFGTKPWSRAGERAVAESAAAAVGGSAPAALAGSAAADEGNETGTYSTAAPHGENNPEPRILDDDKAEDEIEDDGNVEDDERAKIEEDEMVIDDAVKPWN